MKPELLEIVVMDRCEFISLPDLAQMCELSLPDLDELIEYGALVPVERAEKERLFSATCVMTLRQACQVRRAYDLDLFTVVILLGYLERIDLLEGQLKNMTAHGHVHAAASTSQ